MLDHPANPASRPTGTRAVRLFAQTRLAENLRRQTAELVITLEPKQSITFRHRW